MRRRRPSPGRACLLLGCLWLVAVGTDAQPAPPFGQAGKDVEWVPTPDVLVDTMLDMAAVTPDDLVVDLGSGDGKTVIAAARLGARAVGVEYESNLVDYSRSRAAAAGVDDLTTFVAGNLFDFDLSPATVITMFLLPDLNMRLRPVLFDLAPGTRIVSNTWDLSGTEDDLDAPGWVPDRTIVLDPCPGWCTAHLWTVPAKVAGRWRTADGGLELEQEYQMVSGQLHTAAESFEVRHGKLVGRRLSFTVGDTTYEVTAQDDRLSGTATSPGGRENWDASR